MRPATPDEQASRQEMDALIAAFYIDGLRYSDIAERIKRPISTVSSTVRRLQAAGIVPRRQRDYRFV